MKLSLVSLGCAKNLVDSEMILSLMKKNDFELTVEVEEADVIIVNTCGFIDSSKQESINKIIELGQLNKILIQFLIHQYFSFHNDDAKVPLRIFFF